MGQQMMTVVTWSPPKAGPQVTVWVTRHGVVPYMVSVAVTQLCR